MIKRYFENSLDSFVVSPGQNLQVIDCFVAERGKKIISCEDGACVDYFIFGQHSEIDLFFQLGSKTKLRLFGVFSSTHTQPMSLKLRVDIGPNQSSANIYLLGLAGDESKLHLDGSLNIEHAVAQGDGHLLEEYLVLGENVHLKALPVLSVASADVSASHAAKIDVIDRDRMFYITAKGVDEQKAKSLILDGYVQKILSHFDAFDEQFLFDLKSRILHPFIS